MTLIGRRDLINCGRSGDSASAAAVFATVRGGGPSGNAVATSPVNRAPEDMRVAVGAEAIQQAEDVGPQAAHRVDVDGTGIQSWR